MTADKKKREPKEGVAPSQQALKRAVKRGEYDDVLQQTGEYARDMHGHNSSRDEVASAQTKLEKLAEKEQTSGHDDLANVLKAGAKRLRKDLEKRQNK